MIAGRTDLTNDIRIRIADFLPLSSFEEVSIVIPWMDNGNPMRARNLEFLLTTLKGLDAKHVILACQGEAPAELPANVEVLTLEADPDGLIRKAALLNRSFPLCRKTVFQIDADLIYDFGRSLTRSLPEALSLPYKAFQFLSEVETAKLVKTRSIAIPQDTKLQNTSPVAGGFIMRRALLRNEFTFDERLKGWGGEDLDFFQRVRGKYPVFRIPFSAVHLNHGNDRRAVRLSMQQLKDEYKKTLTS